MRDIDHLIKPEMLPQVVELFAQEQQALDRSHGGLGLAIVDSLVLEVVLPAFVPVPAAEDTRVPSDLATSARAEHVAPRRILVVDDNRDAAELTAEPLRNRGHDVRVAYDDPSALAIVADFVPGVALLDIGLPVMDGYALALRLQARLAPHGPHMIAVTGYGHEGDRSRSREAGFDLHLVKPIDLARLQAANVQVTADSAGPAST